MANVDIIVNMIDKTKSGLSSISGGLKTLVPQFLSIQERTDAWSEGLKNSGDISKVFASHLSEQANAMGITGSKYQSLISASGLYSKEQLTNAQNSALVAEKARMLSGEVAKGAMTATQAGEAFKKYTDDLAKSEYQSASTSKILQEMAGDFAKVGAVVGGVTLAAKAIYDLGKSGAELQFTENRFNRLSDSINTTSDALLDDLRTATRGLYSDTELMASASDLMALGLAKTHDEAVRLATVSGGLNMNMNQLVLTLTNMTTMRFDALGVSTDGFKEKMAALEEQGYSTNDAFKEAFLQQAEDQLEKVGHAADANLGAFMMLEAQMQDTKNSAKELAADGLAPIIRYLAESTGEMNENKRVLQEINEELYKEYSAHKVLTPEMERLIKQHELGAAMTEYYRESVEQNTQSLNENAAAVADVSSANNDLLSLTMSLSEENESYNESLVDEQAKLAELQSEIDNLISQGYSPQGAAVQEVTEKYNEQAEKIQELKDKHADAMAQIAADLLLAKLQADGFTDAEYNMAIAMLESTGQIDSAAAQTALAMDKIASAAQNAGTAGMESFGGIMSKVMEDGVISNEELQAALDELSAESAVEEVDSISSATDEMSAVGDANINELQSSVNGLSTESAINEFDALIDRLNAIPTVVPVDIEYTVNGEVPPPLTGGQSISRGQSASGGQVFNIANATFIQNESGSWNPL